MMPSPSFRRAASTLAAATLALALMRAPLSAQTPHPAPKEQQALGKEPSREPAKDAGPTAFPPDSISRRTAQIGGDRIAYTATAGSLPLYRGKGEVAARIFYTGYVREGDAAGRPVTFVFNGGPGAGSAFLHLGALGPRVVPFNEAGDAAIEPVRLIDNPDSWLPFTDLVFVDPVGTGFSRATEGDEGEKAFLGTAKDADALKEFVQLYLTRNDRSLGPVFLAGESYGGFRAMLLANRLLSAGVRVKGAVLISPALEFALIRGDDYTLLPLALVLPSIAASNVELKEGRSASLDMIGEVETFSRTGYLLHLAAALRQDDAVNGLLERYTGLPREVIDRNHGRIGASLFMREYQRGKDRALSHYDGSVSAPLVRPADSQGHGHFDPVLDRTIAVLTPAMAHYTRQELGFRTDLDYRLLNRDVNGKWDYGTTPNRQGFADALGDLQEARVHNPALRILIAHGYTDLVTPYGVSQFLVDQLRPIEGAAPITLRTYRGGHMMYFRAPSRRQLHEDTAELYRAAMD